MSHIELNNEGAIAFTCHLCDRPAQGRCPMCWRPLCTAQFCYMPHMRKEFQQRQLEREIAIQAHNIPNTLEARDIKKLYLHV